MKLKLQKEIFLVFLPKLIKIRKHDKHNLMLIREIQKV